MKKRLVLAILPALMVLSGCKSLYSAAAVKVDLFAEDTLAHDEVFGSGSLGVRKANPFKLDLNPVDSSSPAIAVQTKVESADHISIRFVAAVRLDTVHDGALSHTNIVWTRTMFKDDGSVKKEEDDKPSLQVYTSILDGETPLSISDFNEANGGTNYTHFAVYTMRNIPTSGVDDASDYYLNVSVNVSCIDPSYNAQSKVVATTVDQSTQFSFEAEDTDCFCVKKAGTTFTSYAKAGSTREGYWAAFQNISLSTGNSFLLVYRHLDEDHSKDRFEIYGYEKLHAGDAPYTDDKSVYHADGFYEFTQDGSSQFSVCPSTASYYFFLENSTNNIKPKYCLSKEIKLNPGVWDGTGSPKYAAYITNSGYGGHSWYMMTLENGLYKCSIANVPDDSSIIFCRLKPTAGNDGDGWYYNDDNVNGYKVWNQTGNLSSLNTGNGTYSISGWDNGDDGKSGGSWN